MSCGIGEPSHAFHASTTMLMLPSSATTESGIGTQAPSHGSCPAGHEGGEGGRRVTIAGGAVAAAGGELDWPKRKAPKRAPRTTRITTTTPRRPRRGRPRRRRAGPACRRRDGRGGSPSPLLRELKDAVRDVLEDVAVLAEPAPARCPAQSREHVGVPLVKGVGADAVDEGWGAPPRLHDVVRLQSHLLPEEEVSRLPAPRLRVEVGAAVAMNGLGLGHLDVPSAMTAANVAQSATPGSMISPSSLPAIRQLQHWQSAREMRPNSRHFPRVCPRLRAR